MVQVHGELGVCESFNVLQSSRETLDTPRVDGRPACPQALSCKSSTIFSCLANLGCGQQSRVSGSCHVLLQLKSWS